MDENHTKLPRQKVLPKRLLSVLVAVVLGGRLGWWIGLVTLQLITKFYPPDKMGAIWGTGVAAAVTIWKAFTDTVDLARSGWDYFFRQNAKFDHVKAMLNFATITFGLVLGYKTYVDVIDPKIPSTSNTEFVYVVTQQAKEAPRFLVHRALMFAIAGLHNADMPIHAVPNTVKKEEFRKDSVSLSERKINSIKDLILKLAQDCIKDGTNNPLELTVYGFANDQSVLDGQKQKRKDSDVLNTAIANFRGEAVYEALKTVMISKEFSKLSEELNVKWDPWNNFGEMREVRDHKIFNNVQIELDPTSDHRSAVIVVSKPGNCPWSATQENEKKALVISTTQ